LTGLEQDKIVNEYKEVMSEISDLLDLLAKPERVTSVIESELKEVQAEFGKAGGDSGRRSFIEMNATELFTEDLITPQDMVVTLSHTGYMKSQPLTEYKAQKRGGRGKAATTTKDEDWISTLFVANTHDTILCFSDRGRLYWLKVWEVPAGSRTSRGKPIVNMFPLIEGEKITTILPIKGYVENQYVFMATRNGVVKKSRLSDFSNPRKAGIIAVDLDDGDILVGAAITGGNQDVMLFSDAGKAVRFDENDVRPMGRTARGVKGMNLGVNQKVIAMLVAPSESEEKLLEDAKALPSVLTATENGYGKRTSLVEYTRHGRGTKGMIAIQTSDRNGKLVAASLVSESDQIMLITTGGILVRTRVSEIREMGRSTQGVTLISVDSGTVLSGLQRIAEGDEDDGDDDDDIATDDSIDKVSD
jgi:DNA gyrase subunit A